MIPVTVIERKHKIHFIGIGGIGMSGLAEYYLRNGCEITGSDVSASGITARLEALGAKIFIGHSARNVNASIGLVVYSSAVEGNNPELNQARKLEIKTVKRAEQLAQLVNERYLIAVSGTHGKTTTTAMIAKVLVDAGFDPLVFVGGSVSEFGGAASRYGSGKYAVVEADEYDRSFLQLKPDIAVITNIDEDHLDIYKDLADIIKNFRIFCEGSKPDAKIIYCGDDKNLRGLAAHVGRDNYSYGFDSNNYYRIDDYNAGDQRINFAIMNSHGSYKDISLNLVGKHNALNSAACFGVSKLLDISFEKYRSIIGGFHTVDRRLQLKYDKNKIKVFDDYAHHPSEIASSLSGLRDLPGTSRIIAVFQPHLYTRTKDFYKQFAEKLSAADEVILMDIYPAREKPIKNVDSGLIYDELVKKNKNITLIKIRSRINEYLLGSVRAGDIIVFQGAGDITDLCSEFVMKLNKQKD